MPVHHLPGTYIEPLVNEPVPRGPWPSLQDIQGRLNEELRAGGRANDTTVVVSNEACSAIMEEIGRMNRMVRHASGHQNHATGRIRVAMPSGYVDIVPLSVALGSSRLDGSVFFMLTSLQSPTAQPSTQTTLDDQLRNHLRGAVRGPFAIQDCSVRADRNTRTITATIVELSQQSRYYPHYPRGFMVLRNDVITPEAIFNNSVAPKQPKPPKEPNRRVIRE